MPEPHAIELTEAHFVWQRFALQILEQSGRAIIEECTFKILLAPNRFGKTSEWLFMGAGVAAPENFGYFPSLESSSPEAKHFP